MYSIKYLIVIGLHMFLSEIDRTWWFEPTKDIRNFSGKNEQKTCNEDGCRRITCSGDFPVENTICKFKRSENSLRSNKNQLKLNNLTLSLHLWTALPTLLHSECFGISTTMLKHKTALVPPPRRTYNIDEGDLYWTRWGSLSHKLYIFRILIISNSTHFLR